MPSSNSYQSVNSQVGSLFAEFDSLYLPLNGRTTVKAYFFSKKNCLGLGGEEGKINKNIT